MKKRLLSWREVGCILITSCLFNSVVVTLAANTPLVESKATNAPVYSVTRFELAYSPLERAPHPDLPGVSNLLATVRIARQEDWLVVPESGSPAATNMTLAEFNQSVRAARLTLSALEHVRDEIVKTLNQRGIVAVWVAPARDNIDTVTLEDLRTDPTVLRLMIHVGEIEILRTLAKGPRIAASNSVNSPKHARIARNSPLQPARAGRRGDLLWKPKLDGYVERLNRFPGRSVDASIASADGTNGLVLDYLIHEDKQWIAYAQFANTGTKSAGSWRERFGTIVQQVTSSDDLLSLDYITSGFEHSHAGFGSYERPLIFPNYLKARGYGSYGTYQADELGLSGQSLNGSQAVLGGELVYNPFALPEVEFRHLSFAPFFLDLTFGARWEGIEVENETFNGTSDTDLFLPYVGVSLASVSQEAKFSVGLQLEGNWADLAGTDEEDFIYLGRENADAEWMAAKWGVGLAFFVEPLLSEPSSSNSLVHELSFSTRGQQVFADRRLIPQQQEVIGGFYSVRGYPESIDAGDDVVLGTVEYRIYFARTFDIAPDQYNVAVGSKTTAGTQLGNPFKFRARDVYGRPEWDLILRGFFESGFSWNHRPETYERNRTLVSAGLGAELQIRRNFNVRVDLGVPMKSIHENVSEPARSGHPRVHFSATLAL